MESGNEVGDLETLPAWYPPFVDPATSFWTGLLSKYRQVGVRR